MAKLKDELKKRDPFASVTQEAMLGILRTSDLLENRIARVLRPFKLTPAQYNVLRILRGEGKPLPTQEVAGRMIQVAPAITRLTENLRSRGLIAKRQSESDARVYLLKVTEPGESLLDQLDDPISTMHESLLGSVPPTKLRQLNAVLENIRTAVDRH